MQMGWLIYAVETVYNNLKKGNKLKNIKDSNRIRRCIKKWFSLNKQKAGGVMHWREAKESTSE